MKTKITHIKTLALIAFMLLIHLQINAATYTFNGNGNWSNPANWVSNTPPVNLNPFIVDYVIIQSGSTCNLDLEVSLGYNVLTIQANAVLNVSATTTNSLDPYNLKFGSGGELNINGTLNVGNPAHNLPSDGSVVITEGTTNVNLGGTVNLLKAGTMMTDNVYSSSPSSELNIDGTINILGDGGNCPNFGIVTISTTGIVNITGVGMPFVNSLGISNNYHNDAALINNGVINCDEFLSFTGGATFAGSGNLNGNGLLTFSPGPTQNGPHVIIDIGNSPGVLTLNLNLDLGATDEVKVEIGGTTSGTQYDVLAGTGTKNLNGTLDLALYNNYVPALNESYTIITGTISGAFSNINYPPLPAGLYWQITYNSNSVVLSIVPNAPTPVNLTKFSAQEKDNQSHLSWTTAQETNNQGFEIERSIDGVTFEKIGFVDGHGTSSIITDYEFIDRTPKQGVNYYRLKQIDIDGQHEYSKIEHITIEAPSVITIHPNPAQDQLYVEGITKPAPYTIYNMLGQGHLSGTLLHGVIDISELENGLYIIEVIHANQKQQVKFYKR